MGILESSYKQLRTELQTTYAKWLFKSIFENRCMNMTGEFILPT